MKKIILFVAVITLLTGAGCSKNKQSVNIVDDVDFQKKKDCAEYKEQMKNDVAKNYGDSAGLGEIFYSPKTNSCLYGILKITEKGSSYIQELTIIDYLNNKIIYNDKCSNDILDKKDDDICDTTYKNFDKEVERLKSN